MRKCLTYSASSSLLRTFGGFTLVDTMTSMTNDLQVGRRIMLGVILKGRVDVFVGVGVFRRNMDLWKELPRGAGSYIYHVHDSTWPR